MAGIEKAQILVVDDDPKNLIAMEAALAPLGEHVVPVASGQQALKALLSLDVALILLDVQMPGMTGLETASLIRMRERTRHVPIVFVTAYTPENDSVASAYEHGAVDYLIKPFDPSVLRAKVWFFAELWRRGRQLERRIRDLARAEAAAAEAREASEFERRLLGVVSHDIRSPLSAVKVTLARLLERPPDEPRALTHALERMQRGVTKIEQLTNLFLDATRARVGGGLGVVPRTADLRELCRAATDEAQTAHPGRTIHLHMDDGDGEGIWDPLRLQQVLSNLLDNALKFSPQDTAVEVSVGLAGPIVSVSVHNQGKPIPPALLPTIFEPFARDESRTTTGGSTGLGLYIVREIARAHGGDVTVSSSAERGTTFTVALPRHGVTATPKDARPL